MADAYVTAHAIGVLENGNANCVIDKLPTISCLVPATGFASFCCGGRRKNMLSLVRLFRNVSCLDKSSRCVAVAANGMLARW